MSDGTTDFRRERRRRKILDNAEARLAKITGVAESIRSDGADATRRERRRWNMDNADARLAKITGASKSDLKDPDNTPRNDAPDPEYCNGVAEREPVEKSEVERATTHTIHTVPADVHKDVGGSKGTLFHKSSQNSFFTKDMEARTCETAVEDYGFISIIFSSVQWVCLAIITRLMFTFEYGFLFGESLLAPFAAMEAVLLALKQVLPGTSQQTNIVGALLLLCGINSHVAHTLIMGSDLAWTMASDLSMYLVSFICFHVALQCL